VTIRTSGALVMFACLAAAAHAQTPALPPGTKVQKDVVFGSADGKDLRLDLYIPAAPAAKCPILVRVGPVRETPGGPAADLLARGYALVYAGYLPEGPAGRVFRPFPADVQSARAALRWVHDNAEKLTLDADRLGLWGAGHGATVAALAAMSDAGDPAGLPRVRALCLFEGTTDWRNAELYGDEFTNLPGSPAYQLFGGNPKDHPDEARQASAVNFIRPTSPATLVVTLASDEQRAMHLIFAETLRKAGVPSALYEEPLSAAAAGRAVDEGRLNRTLLEFFDDTVRGDRGNPRPLTLEQEIDQLAAAGLYKQARRLIEGQLTAPGNADAAARATWFRKLRQINDRQQEPALKELTDARRAAVAAGPTAAVRPLWTIREVLTDPDRIGRYTVEATMPQQVFDARAAALRLADGMNRALVIGDLPVADAQAAALRAAAQNGAADPAVAADFLARFGDVRGKSARVWPPGVRGAAFASDFGQDLYGYWMDFKAGGVTQRLRYVPPGKFTMGSSKEEWGRLPGEPLLEPTEVSKGFWLGETEVTQALWEGVMGAADNPASFKAADGHLRLPVENVSYAHAVNFLSKLGVDARLPTEAEWEYACRAGSAYMVSGTGRLSDMAWFWDEAQSAAAETGGDIRILHELETDRSAGARSTHPVRQKLPNRWGLYDMQGNVWEWCGGSSPDKPREFHPARGGSWLSIPQSCRAARDVWFSVEQQGWTLGLRICIPAN
jgi:formylglycine-generating enzyme required for sulfatase activity/acetyl esterase/lipase